MSFTKSLIKMALMKSFKSINKSLIKSMRLPGSANSYRKNVLMLVCSMDFITFNHIWFFIHSSFQKISFQALLCFYFPSFLLSFFLPSIVISFFSLLFFQISFIPIFFLHSFFLPFHSFLF